MKRAAATPVLEPRPPAHNWPAERALLPARAMEPGVKVTHILGTPKRWLVQALVDRMPAGDAALVRKHGDLDAAVDHALATARNRILATGAPLADTVHARKAVAIAG